MNRALVVLILAGAAYAQQTPPASSLKNNLSLNHATSEIKEADSPGKLPPAPAGNASLLGGTIRDLDPIRDQMVIQAFGGGKSTVLFDERTRVYLDGRQGSLRDLSAGQHIYAETVLDKADIFARNIHVATRAVAEESSGQVVNYDSKSGELVIHDALFPRSVKLRMDGSTAVLRGDQTVTAASLHPGTLVHVRFTISSGQEPVARQISVLAQPGTDFVFLGHVTHLDLHTHLLVLSDPLNHRSYELYCVPSLVPADLREGADVTVTARFNGARYAVTAITLNPAPVNHP